MLDLKIIGGTIVDGSGGPAIRADLGIRDGRIVAICRVDASARETIDAAGMVVHYSPPLVVLRTKVLDVPEDQARCTGLYRRLLELNATDLVHGAYGIEEGDIILADSLELENLDFNEFQASVDSMQLAVASHLESLSPFRNC